MFVFNRNIIKSLNCYARFYSSFGKKCPYNVLRLRRNCTDKEIKEAFIRMSKEYHPDKNKEVGAQERFVSIVEAYNVLGKPSSRAHYDIISSNPQATYVYKTHVPWNLRKNSSYQYQYQNSTGSTQQPRSEKSYYGVKGVKKMPNYKIIIICCGFALLGLVIQMAVITRSFRIHQDNIDEKSRAAAEELDKVRAAAGENGNEVQTRILLEKIVNGAKPTVATATLGQALASDKKSKESPTECVLTEYGLSEDSGGDWYTSSFRSSIKVGNARTIKTKGLTIAILWIVPRPQKLDGAVKLNILRCYYFTKKQLVGKQLIISKS